MARLASQSQGGFYATPTDEVKLISKRLVAQEETTVNLLDPCCGEGLTLNCIGKHLLVNHLTTPHMCGVELEDSRAEKAKTALHKVVKGGYETLRASNEVFSFMWLNPPYDNSKTGGRMETLFLRDLTAPNKYLQEGGLLGFCIPKHVLKECALLLANRFRDIKVYRFTDENYPVYKQIVVFGYRAKGRIDPEKARETRQMLETISDLPYSEVPTLAENDGVTFIIPEAKGEVTLFRGSVLDPVEIMEDLKKSPAWADFSNLLMPDNLKHEVGLKQPILPLKPSHMGTAIAAGAIGGNMGDHILVGITAKEVENNTQFEDDGKTAKVKHIQTERYVTKTKVFSLHEGMRGVFTLE